MSSSKRIAFSCSARTTGRLMDIFAFPLPRIKPGASSSCLSPPMEASAAGGLVQQVVGTWRQTTAAMPPGAIAGCHASALLLYAEACPAVCPEGAEGFTPGQILGPHSGPRATRSHKTKEERGSDELSDAEQRRTASPSVAQGRYRISGALFQASFTSLAVWQARGSPTIQSCVGSSSLE